MLSLKLDKVAIFLSGVCLIHCLIAPVLLTLIPIFSLNFYVEDVLFHRLMFGIVLPTSLIALFIGCMKHRSWLIIFTGTIGIATLFIIALFGHDFFSIWQERLYTSIGGIFIVISHTLNYRACQRITCDEKNCASEHHH